MASNHALRNFKQVRKTVGTLPPDAPLRRILSAYWLDAMEKRIADKEPDEIPCPHVYLMACYRTAARVREFDRDLARVLQQLGDDAADALLDLASACDRMPWEAAQAQVFVKSSLLARKKLSARLDVTMEDGGKADAVFDLCGTSIALAITPLEAIDLPCDRESPIRFDLERTFEKFDACVPRLCADRPNAIVVPIVNPWPERGPSAGLSLAIDALTGRSTPSEHVDARSQGWLQSERIREARRRVGAYFFVEDCALVGTRCNDSASHGLSTEQVAAMQEILSAQPAWFKMRPSIQKNLDLLDAEAAAERAGE